MTVLMALDEIDAMHEAVDGKIISKDALSRAKGWMRRQREILKAVSRCKVKMTLRPKSVTESHTSGGNEDEHDEESSKG